MPEAMEQQSGPSDGGAGRSCACTRLDRRVTVCSYLSQVNFSFGNYDV